jgi:hypothetical protein
MRTDIRRRTDRLADMTKLIVAFRSFVNAPNKCVFLICSRSLQVHNLMFGLNSVHKRVCAIPPYFANRLFATNVAIQFTDQNFVAQIPDPSVIARLCNDILKCSGRFYAPN